MLIQTSKKDSFLSCHLSYFCKLLEALGDVCADVEAFFAASIRIGFCLPFTCLKRGWELCGARTQGSGCTAQELLCQPGLAVGFGGFLLCLQLTEGLTAWSDPLVLCSGQLAEPNADKGDVKFF